ncbi:MAG: hypothetical protein DMF84_21860 [Acidobacteria bacterium]|nr:MAG: hypothetical protein DMF84_21860 [Acidobacteriota bacterium]
MKHWLRLLVAISAALAARPAYAQNEAALKEYFEGRSVVVKLDMPATSDGIDVFPDARRPLNFGDYSERIKSSGVAIRSGNSALVTRVRVKDKLLEFQLGGGGFGTFGDDTSTSVYIPDTPKSKREKDLEQQVKHETDAARKRRVQRELDDVRAERRREDSRNEAVKATAEEQKKQRIAEQRLHAGSRFNIRYQNGVPPGLEPAGIMRALAGYVDFPFATDQRPAEAHVETPELRAPIAAAGAIYKGMTLADAEQAFGRAEKTSERTEGALRVVTATFSRDDQRIVGEFVEGVLIRYSISSR